MSKLPDEAGWCELLTEAGAPYGSSGFRDLGPVRCGLRAVLRREIDDPKRDADGRSWDPRQERALIEITERRRETAGAERLRALLEERR